MKIRKCEHWEDYMNLNLLLYDYIVLLNKIEQAVPVRTQNELAGEYFYTPDTDSYLAFDDSDMLLGFCILGHGQNCHPKADLYIEEFYIIPEYSNKGYGTQFAKELIINTDANIVCFYELKKNTRARLFWKKIFQDWKNETSNIPDSENFPDYLDYFIFRRIL